MIVSALLGAIANKLMGLLIGGKLKVFDSTLGNPHNSLKVRKYFG